MSIANIHRVVIRPLLWKLCQWYENMLVTLGGVWEANRREEERGGADIRGVEISE